MIEVFVENASGSFLLEEDGRLSLKSLKLDPDTITIQGRREQVGPDGMTKRSWTELKQVLLELGESDELGTKDVPLKVAGNPLAGPGQGAGYNRQLLQDIYEVVLELKEGKADVSVSISDIGTDQWVEVVEKARLSHDFVTDIQASTPKETVPAFDWDPRRSELDQSERYMHHLKQYIRINNTENGWVDAAKDPQLLSFAGMETLGFNFKGTTDVVVATCEAIRGLLPNQGIRLLFDLKKEVTKLTAFQAQARLLLANLHSLKARPVMVLTDLCDEWHLLWLDGSTVNQHAFTSRAQAVGFIEDFLADRIEASMGGHPTAARVAKRRRVEARLTPGAAASAAFAEQMESLEGVVDPNELMQMRAAFMLRQFVNSPCAPSWRSASEESGV